MEGGKIMKYIYLKPELENLSQGERIAFVRQVRRMSQDELADKLGFTGESKRRGVTRYERGDRVPKEDRLNEISNILNVNVKCLKEFDFRNDEDMIYMLLWMEEMYPRMDIDLDIPEYFPLKRDKKLGKFMREWKIIREKRYNHEITYDEYIEWKLQYEYKEGEDDEKIS